MLFVSAAREEVIVSPLLHGGAALRCWGEALALGPCVQGREAARAGRARGQVSRCVAPRLPEAAKMTARI